MADAHGHDIKYGGGETTFQKLLAALSDEINTFELQEFALHADEATDMTLDSFARTKRQRQTLLDRIQSIDPANPDTN